MQKGMSMQITLHSQSELMWLFAKTVSSWHGTFAARAWSHTRPNHTLCQIKCTLSANMKGNISSVFKQRFLQMCMSEPHSLLFVMISPCWRLPLVVLFRITSTHKETYRLWTQIRCSLSRWQSEYIQIEKKKGGGMSAQVHPINDLTFTRPQQIRMNT